MTHCHSFFLLSQPSAGARQVCPLKLSPSTTLVSSSTHPFPKSPGQAQGWERGDYPAKPSAGFGEGILAKSRYFREFQRGPQNSHHKLRLPGIIKHFHVFKELSYALSHSDSQRSYRAGIINPFENGCGGLSGCITRGLSSVLGNPVSPRHQRPLPTACSQPGTARRETPLLGTRAWRTPHSLPYALRTAMKAKKHPPTLLSSLPLSLPQVRPGLHGMTLPASPSSLPHFLS